MCLEHSFGFASGDGAYACHAVGFRYPAEYGFSPEMGECFILELIGDQIRSRCVASWYTGLWRSVAGAVFVTSAAGAVLHTTPGLDTPVVRHALGFHPFGIWGLDDDHVYAWGRAGGVSSMARWDGRRWEAMEAPRVPIVALHGPRPDLLFAVGGEGSIAWWDGAAWHDMAAPEPYALQGVFVVSEDEVYACGGGGHLLQGSVHGWRERLQAPFETIAGVAAWQGQIWVACLGALGLCVLEGQELRSIKPKIRALTMEPRERLLVTTPDLILETTDGARFNGFNTDGFIGLVQKNIPLWETRDG